MRIAVPVALAFLAGCATHERPSQINPYQLGISTEAQLAARRGQPLSRTVADDGTITDIYRMEPGGFTLNTLAKVGADGKPTPIAMSEVAGKYPPEDLAVRVRYIYSPDGVLRKILDEFPMIGADGHIQYEVVDPQGPNVKITRVR
jgi:hypothetical protein